MSPFLAQASAQRRVNAAAGLWAAHSQKPIAGGNDGTEVGENNVGMRNLSSANLIAVSLLEGIAKV